MEDKIEVGEYVRTNDGDIFEFGGYYKCGNIDSMIDKDGLLCGNQKKCCKNHKENLIELIEVGDYVNGMQVLDIYFPRDLWDVIEIRVDSKYINFIIPDEIKSIVTKEQFESIKYEVKDE